MDQEGVHNPNEFLMMWHLQEQSERDLLDASLRRLMKKTTNPLMECISALDETLNLKVVVLQDQIDERLKQVEYAVYKEDHAPDRFDDIYARLNSGDTILKQHINDCNDTIAALDSRTKAKVFEQDQKLDELERFRKLTDQINQDYQDLNVRMQKFQAKTEEVIQDYTSKCNEEVKNCQIVLR